MADFGETTRWVLKMLQLHLSDHALIMLTKLFQSNMTRTKKVQFTSIQDGSSTGRSGVSHMIVQPQNIYAAFDR